MKATIRCGIDERRLFLASSLFVAPFPLASLSLVPAGFAQRLAHSHWSHKKMSEKLGLFSFLHRETSIFVMKFLIFFLWNLQFFCEFSYVWRLGSPNAIEMVAKINVWKIGFILFFTSRNIDFRCVFLKFFLMELSIWRHRAAAIGKFAIELVTKKNVKKIGFILFSTSRNIDFRYEYFKYFFGGT